MKPMLLLAATAVALTCCSDAGVAKAAGLDFWLVVNKGEVQVLSAPVAATASEKSVVLHVGCQSCRFSVAKSGGIAAAFTGTVTARCRLTRGDELLITADRMAIGSDPSRGASVTLEGSDGNPVRLSSGGAASGLPFGALTARRIELWPDSARIEGAGTIRLDRAPSPAAESPGPDEDALGPPPASPDPLPPSLPSDDSRPEPGR